MVVIVICVLRERIGVDVWSIRSLWGDGFTLVSRDVE
jgi:hypothetical protein